MMLSGVCPLLHPPPNWPPMLPMTPLSCTPSHLLYTPHREIWVSVIAERESRGLSSFLPHHHPTQPVPPAFFLFALLTI